MSPLGTANVVIVDGIEVDLLKDREIDDGLVRTGIVPVKLLATSVLSVATMIVATTDHRVTSIDLLDGTRAFGTESELLFLPSFVLLKLFDADLKITSAFLTGLGGHSLIIVSRSVDLPVLPTHFDDDTLVAGDAVVVTGLAPGAKLKVTSVAMDLDAIARDRVDDDKVAAIGRGTADKARETAEAHLELVFVVLCDEIGAFAVVRGKELDDLEFREMMTAGFGSDDGTDGDSALLEVELDHATDAIKAKAMGCGTVEGVHVCDGEDVKAEFTFEFQLHEIREEGSFLLLHLFNVEATRDHLCDLMCGDTIRVAHHTEDVFDLCGRLILDERLDESGVEDVAFT